MLIGSVDGNFLFFEQLSCGACWNKDLHAIHEAPNPMSKHTHEQISCTTTTDEHFLCSAMESWPTSNNEEKENFESAAFRW